MTNSVQKKKMMGKKDVNVAIFSGGNENELE